MRMKAIASGSNGNSIYVGNDNTHILVDAGISKKKIENGLSELDISANDIDALVVTHEHTDHIGGIGVLLRKYPINVYGTEGTIREILNYKSLGKVDESLFHVIDYDREFNIKDIKVIPMRISHDAAEPCAYKFVCGNKKSAVVTDLGYYDEYIVDYLKDLDTLFIEANHDKRMLETGPYPYALKKRILGNKGHLSNENCGRLLDTLLHDNMKHVVLSHLSHENNLPELAFEAVRMEINLSESRNNADDFHIMVANRTETSETLCF